MKAWILNNKYYVLVCLGRKSAGIDASAARADLVKNLNMRVQILTKENEGLDPKNEKMKVQILNK